MVGVTISLADLFHYSFLGFPLAAEKYGMILNNTCVAVPDSEGRCVVAKDNCNEGFAAFPGNPINCICSCEPLEQLRGEISVMKN